MSQASRRGSVTVTRRRRQGSASGRASTVIVSQRSAVSGDRSASPSGPAKRRAALPTTVPYRLPSTLPSPDRNVRLGCRVSAVPTN
eukprot:5106955-Prymnesium_polylepis.1